MSASRYLRPDVIAQVQRLDLRARFIVEGFMAGLHSSPFHGFSVEFSEHRKYVPGDDLRTIDWNVLARTDRLHVKKYQAETNMEGYLLVDTSASMAYGGDPAPGTRQKDDAAAGDSNDESAAGSTGPALSTQHSALNKLDYAICLAAAMGYLMVQQQDAVGLGIFDTQLRSFLPPRARRSHLIRILAELANVQASQDTEGKGLATALHEMARRIHKRSLIVVFSDFLCDMPAVLEALHHLRFRHHDLIFFQVLDWTETQFPFQDPTRFDDPETGESISTQPEAIRENYLAALHDFIGEYRRACAAVRADFVTVDTAMTFDRALTQYLLERQRQF
jgi:uncharacterized protein (DUF58 family)